jgi:hypothetical protein
MAIQLTRHDGRAWQQSAAWLLLTCMALFSGCATLGDKPPNPPITVSEVISMSKEGIPPNIIVDKMRNSGTAYRFTAAQLAKLHDQGVDDQVINYMQQTYLDAVRQDESLSDWQYWTVGIDGFWYGGPYFGWPRDWRVVGVVGRDGHDREGERGEEEGSHGGETGRDGGGFHGGGEGFGGHGGGGGGRR